MFIQPFVGNYAHALPMQLAGWLRAPCKLHAVYAWTGHYRAWIDGLWWGHRVGLTPLCSHWAQLSLAHSVGGERVCVPPKHPVYSTALAAALRDSAPLCTPPQSCRSDFISSEQGLSPGYPSTASVLSVSVLGCIQHDNRDSLCHLPSLGSMGMTHNF